VILGLIVNSLIAYALARLRFPGRKFILPVVIALIIVPFETVAIPMLLLVNRLPWLDGSVGWLDTYHVQIIPFIVDVLMIFLFYQFFIGFPKELEEAAIVDGASRFQIFYKIVLPLSGPIFATVAILTFLHRWGDYLWPLMVTRGPEVRPLMVGYEAFFGLSTRVQWGDIMAYGAMATLPVLILFIILQRSFINSIASTGIKG
jgi:multiple sugar transport system permease protein